MPEDASIPTIALTGLSGNTLPTLSPLQQFLTAHEATLEITYWVLWSVVLVCVLSRYALGINVMAAIKRL